MGRLLTRLSLVSRGNEVTGTTVLLFNGGPRGCFVPSRIGYIRFCSGIVEGPVPTCRVCHKSIFRLISRTADFIVDHISG